MKVTQIEKLNQLISRTDMTGNQKVEWLTNFIDEHVTEQLRLNDVSNRRELLISFHVTNYAEPHTPLTYKTVSKQVDDFLKTN